MADRTSLTERSGFSVVVSFLLAAVLGLVIGSIYGAMDGVGWGPGFLVGATITLVAGLLLSFLFERGVLPPLRFGRTGSADGSRYHAPAKSTGGSTVADAMDSAREKVSGALGAAGQAAKGAYHDAKHAVTDAVGDRKAEANPAGETATEYQAPEPDAVNRRVRDAAREAGEAARGLSGPAPADVAPPARFAGDVPSVDADAAGTSTASDGTAPASEAVDAARPAGLDAPRENRGDDLKKIKGVGPKLEAQLQSLGFWHFDQIGAWTDAELAWVDANLDGFNGRASRDEWVAQANLLAQGEETEFSQRVDKGEVYD